jgi:hypothetical protein
MYMIFKLKFLIDSFDTWNCSKWLPIIFFVYSLKPIPFLFQEFNQTPFYNKYEYVKNFIYRLIIVWNNEIQNNLHVNA